MECSWIEQVHDVAFFLKQLIMDVQPSREDGGGLLTLFGRPFTDVRICHHIWGAESSVVWKSSWLMREKEGKSARSSVWIDLG